MRGLWRPKGQIVDVHCDRARLYHWFSRVMETTILRMTGAASSTMGTTATHDSSHDRSQSPRNVFGDSEECAIAAATADVSPDWITPKMKGPLRFDSLNDRLTKCRSAAKVVAKRS